MMNFPHGPGAPHNMDLIISIGGFRILHTGDLYPDETMETLSHYQIPQREIDVAFVPVFWMVRAAYNHFVLEGINARYIIPMHFDPETSNWLGDIQANFPDATILTKKYASWNLTH